MSFGISQEFIVGGKGSHNWFDEVEAVSYYVTAVSDWGNLVVTMAGIACRTPTILIFPPILSAF